MITYPWFIGTMFAIVSGLSLWLWRMTKSAKWERKEIEKRVYGEIKRIDHRIDTRARTVDDKLDKLLESNGDVKTTMAKVSYQMDILMGREQLPEYLLQSPSSPQEYWEGASVRVQPPHEAATRPQRGGGHPSLYNELDDDYR